MPGGLRPAMNRITISSPWITEQEIYFIGGGPHLAGRGDFLNIYADFNWHHSHLELWNLDMTRCERSIAPLFNLMVAFKVADGSNHGQPKPLTCPPEVYQRALNLYYYTTHRDVDEIIDPHFTMYKTAASPHAVELREDYRKSGQNGV